MTQHQKTRADIVRECTEAVEACWNYYCDQPLDILTLRVIQESLNTSLPTIYTTEQWQEIAHLQDEREKESDS